MGRARKVALGGADLGAEPHRGQRDPRPDDDAERGGPGQPGEELAVLGHDPCGEWREPDWEARLTPAQIESGGKSARTRNWCDRAH